MKVRPPSSPPPLPSSFAYDNKLCVCVCVNYKGTKTELTIMLINSF